MTEEPVLISLPCGAVCAIDACDLYLKELFPFWRLTRDHVSITRYMPTEWGVVRQDVYLARAIVKPPKHLMVDHADRNPLNNRRSNLRIAKPSENAKNQKKSVNKTSKYFGVSLCRSAKKNPWRVFMRRRDGSRFTACTATEIEAARIYDRVAKDEWGEFAPLNEPFFDELRRES